MPGLEICISNELETIVRPLRPRMEGRREDEKEEKKDEERRDAEKDPQGEDEGEGEDENEGEGKSCNEDSTSIESDKAACVAPAAFNEHSASQPRSTGPFDEYLLLRTRYSIPFRLSPFGDSDYRQGPRKREREREKEKERERISRSLDVH